MFEKIQHPITGKWHKSSSAIGSQLIKNYSKKLKLTGGAMDLRPGQDIWYYLNEINNEYSLLRQQLQHYAHDPLGNKDALNAINNSGAEVIAAEARIADPNGIFGPTMIAYFNGQAPPNESARLKQAMDVINANKEALTLELSQANQIGVQQQQQAEQIAYQQQQQAEQLAYHSPFKNRAEQLALQQHQQAMQLAYQQQQAEQLAYQQQQAEQLAYQQQQAEQLAQPRMSALNLLDQPIPATPPPLSPSPGFRDEDWDQKKFDQTHADWMAVQKKSDAHYWDTRQTVKHKMTPEGRAEVDMHEENLTSLQRQFEQEPGVNVGPDDLVQAKANAKARFPSYRFSWM